MLAYLNWLLRAQLNHLHNNDGLKERVRVHLTSRLTNVAESIHLKRIKFLVMLIKRKAFSRISNFALFLFIFKVNIKRSAFDISFDLENKMCHKINIKMIKCKLRIPKNIN